MYLKPNHKPISFDLLLNAERTIGDLALVKYYKITYFEFFQCDECSILNINRIGSIQNGT